MKVEYVEESGVRKSLNFEIEADVVSKEIDARARELARKVRIPGFRPGKVPTDVVRKRFRDQVLMDVAEGLVNKVVPEELKGRGLEPLANPEVKDLKIEENQPMTFRAVFETLPLVELPNYRGLEAKTRKPSVSDEDAQKELDRLREENARFDAIEGRPADKGDYALLDIVFRPAEGGKGGHDENVLVEIGTEDNHPDLNAALLGMSPGETKEVRLNYAEDHPSERLRGKVVDYTLTLSSLKKKMVPAADDEFAKDLGEFGSLEELKADLKKRLVDAEERRIDHEAKHELLKALVAQASFEVPDALVARHLDDRTETFARQLIAQGIDPTKAKIDWKAFRESQREDAIGAAKGDILLHEIAQRERIEVTPPELEAELQRIATRLGKSKEALRHQMEKEGEISALRGRLREGKTLDLLKANARLEAQ
jgi:trigger factor